MVEPIGKGGIIVKCDYCGKGRPKLWTVDGKFCNEECQRKFVDKQKKRRGVR
jgi:predicted nucleic acid-binding Zn ribbon protein